jgi:hypothetical protein
LHLEVTIKKWEDGNDAGEDYVCNECGSSDLYPRWNPLTDDGDALRLAVKLGINFQNESFACWVKWPLQPSLDGTLHHEPYNGDPYAATRRAIVRCAAEIGKQGETK